MAEWLVAEPGKPTLLERALTTGRCYTSVLCAAELLSACQTQRETDAVEGLFRVVRVLGFPARSAASYAATARAAETESPLSMTAREMMVLGLARESKLTVLTHARYDRYRALNVVQVVSHE
jgi:predicted nucleic acid-binding protein